MLTRINNDHGVTATASLGDQRPVADARNRAPSLIYVVRPAAADAHAASTEQGPSYFHGWSPDGQTLDYARNRNGNFDVYTVRGRRRRRTRLTTAEGKDDGPKYSPDGTVHLLQLRPQRSDADLADEGRRHRPGTGDDRRRGELVPACVAGRRVLVFLTTTKGVGDHPENKDVTLRLMNLRPARSTCWRKLFGGQGTINVASCRPTASTWRS